MTINMSNDIDILPIEQNHTIWNMLPDYLRSKIGRENTDTVLDIIQDKLKQYKVSLEELKGGTVITCDSNTFSIEDVSDKFCELIGYSKSELFQVTNRNYLSLIHSADLAEIRRQYDAFLNKGNCFTLEYRMKKKDGTLIHVCNIGCVYVGGVNHVLSVNYIFDITEVKSRKEIEYKGSGRFLETLYDMLPCGVIQFLPRADMFLLAANKGFFEIIGYTRDELFAMYKNSISKIIYTEDFRRIQVAIGKMALNDPTITSELRVITKAGQLRWVHVEVCRLFNENNIEVIQLVGVDNTEEKQQELAKEAQSIEEQQFDRLTGFYSRDYGQTLIVKYLRRKKEEKKGVLFKIYFVGLEHISELYGMGFVNEVLKEASLLLQKQKEHEFILMRMGACEIMGYMKRGEKDTIARFFEWYQKELKKIYPYEKTMCTIMVQLVAISCKSEEEFEQLKNNQFVQLKSSKTLQSQLYFVDTVQDMNMLEQEAIVLQIESKYQLKIMEEYNKEAEDPISFILELLQKAINIKGALHIITEYLGRHFNLDHVLITNVSSKYRYFETLYQWAKHDKEYVDEQIHYITVESFETFRERFEAKTIQSNTLFNEQLACPTYLSSAMFEYGECRGVLSFGNKKKNYVWRKEHEDVIGHVSQLIAARVINDKADSISRVKKEFLSRISHEIRTPMNAISGMTMLAKSVITDSNKVEDCLEIIQDSADYIMMLLGDILDMSCLDEGRITIGHEQFQMSEVLNKVRVLLQNQTEKKEVTYEIIKQYEQNNFYGDEMRISQILNNIIISAVNYTEKGSIELRIEQGDASENKVNMKFTIVDKGIKINKENQKDLFHAFEQGDAALLLKFGGTGLSLSIISRLIQLMGGKLTMINDENNNALITFTLPLEVCEDGISDDRYEQILGKMQQLLLGKRILIAEDNELNLEILKVMLEINGAVVEEAPNGEIALELYSSHEPFFYQAILMDIRMPVMDGFESTRQIRKLNRADSQKIPIIAVTANSLPENYKDFTETGMNGYILKPIGYENLYEAMNGL